jgi:hypothetical protein
VRRWIARQKNFPVARVARRFAGAKRARRSAASLGAPPRTLFNAATSVWHLHDWVWHDPGSRRDATSGFKLVERSVLLV